MFTNRKDNLNLKIKVYNIIANIYIINNRKLKNKLFKRINLVNMNQE